MVYIPTYIIFYTWLIILIIQAGIKNLHVIYSSDIWVFLDLRSDLSESMTWMCDIILIFYTFCLYVWEMMFMCLKWRYLYNYVRLINAKSSNFRTKSSPPRTPPTIRSWAPRPPTKTSPSWIYLVRRRAPGATRPRLLRRPTICCRWEIRLRICLEVMRVNNFWLRSLKVSILWD